MDEQIQTTMCVHITDTQWGFYELIRKEHYSVFSYADINDYIL